MYARGAAMEQDFRRGSGINVTHPALARAGGDGRERCAGLGVQAGYGYGPDNDCEARRGSMSKFAISCYPTREVHGRVSP
jgi:hypothetical protein